ncbi:MAG: hypothetical protein ACOC5T_02020, partial [Elusimicrobiota bacterium]
DKEVIIGVNNVTDSEKDQNKKVRVIKNELPRREAMSYYYLIDADHPSNMYKFQLHSEMKDVFLELAQAVYGMNCHMGSDFADLQDGDESFYTDFIIEKYGTMVHFKRMSDGERKIATLLRDLCNPIYMNLNDIILIDNICMHIYKDRHATLIEKIVELFPDKQFFITTHSPVLVGMKDVELGITIDPYLKCSSLYDLETYKQREEKK